MSGVTVTPTGVREGDPAQLAALCAVRGPSVVAYCRQVAGAAEAGAAAADAFARFRVAVVAAGDTMSLNPEALLISATRTSAAARTHTGAQGDCAAVPALLAARAERTIAAEELERLNSHLEQCWACRAPVERFKAAERAYRDPPEKTVDPALTAQIVAALVAAVPPAPPPAAAAPSSPSPSPSPDDAAEQAAAAPDAPVGEQATEHVAAPDTFAEPGDADASAGAPSAPADDDARSQRRAKGQARAGAVLSRLRPSSSSRAPREPPQPPIARVPTLQRASREGRERSRPRLRLALVLPIVLVVLALLAALFVSGVFGGSDPASGSGVTMPAEPADTTQPELVVVPGAKDAGADAVETAKSRARKGGDSGATKKDEADADSARRASAPAAGSPPPAPAPPPPAAPAVSAYNPVTPPPPARATSPRPSGPKQIDAGGGATGAERLPPAADASDVPDLVPPPEPATP